MKSVTLDRENLLFFSMLWGYHTVKMVGRRDPGFLWVDDEFSVVDVYGYTVDSIWDPPNCPDVNADSVPPPHLEHENVDVVADV